MMTMKQTAFTAASLLLAFCGLTSGQEANCTSTITEVTCATEGLDTLCAVLQATGLEEDLSSDQWTVFAPNDAAFAALGDDNLQAIVNDTVLLTELLLFHVHPDVLFTRDLPCEAGSNLIETASGDDLRSLCVGNTPTYLKGPFNPRDQALPVLVETEIETCSGIIHVIDGVLLNVQLPFPIDRGDVPTLAPAAAATDSPAAPSTTTATDGDCMTISELACSLDDFTTLCGFLGAQNLTDDIDDGLWTVFAPTDSAFGDIAIATEQEIIRNILLFHVIPDVQLMAADLVCTDTYIMANEDDSRHVCERGEDGSMLKFQKGRGNPRDTMPQIVQADVEACNGVIHVVNAVLLP